MHSHPVRRLGADRLLARRLVANLETPTPRAREGATTGRQARLVRGFLFAAFSPRRRGLLLGIRPQIERERDAQQHGPGGGFATLLELIVTLAPLLEPVEDGDNLRRHSLVEVAHRDAAVDHEGDAEQLVAGLTLLPVFLLIGPRELALGDEDLPETVLAIGGTAVDDHAVAQIEPPGHRPARDGQATVAPLAEQRAQHCGERVLLELSAQGDR